MPTIKRNAKRAPFYLMFGLLLWTVSCEDPPPRIVTFSPTLEISTPGGLLTLAESSHHVDSTLDTSNTFNNRTEEPIRGRGTESGSYPWGDISAIKSLTDEDPDKSGGPGSGRSETVTLMGLSSAALEEEAGYRRVDIADMNRQWVPHPTATPTMTIAINGGRCEGRDTFNLIYDSEESLLYEPYRSDTVPRAYLPRDPDAVRDFIRDVVSRCGGANVNLTLEYRRPASLSGSTLTSGEYTEHLRVATWNGASLRGVTYLGSHAYRYNP